MRSAERFPARVVLDTNVALDLYVWEDPAAAALAQLLATGRVRAAACPRCRGEWLRVLDDARIACGPALRARAAARYDAQTDLLAVPAVHSVAGLPRCGDADDQKFIEVAAAVGARAVITRDRELLRLSRRTLRVAGFAIVRPAEVHAALG